MNPHPFDEEDLSLSLPQRILRRLPQHREQLVADLTGPAVPTTPDDVRAAILTLVESAAIVPPPPLQTDPILRPGPRATRVADDLRAANHGPRAPHLPEPPARATSAPPSASPAPPRVTAPDPRTAPPDPECPDCSDPRECRSLSADCMRRLCAAVRRPLRAPRVPARHLYSGAARAAYLAIVRRDDAAAGAPGALLRQPRAHLSPRSPATEPAFLAPLAADCPLRFLLLGAGPDPRAEAAVLRALVHDAFPRFVVVHDVAAESEPKREAYAADAARLLLESLDGLPQGSMVALSCVDLAAPVWRPPGDAAATLYDLATLLGYTLANLSANQRTELLRTLPAQRLLLDLPLADDRRGAGDPRVSGTLTDMEREWLRSAAAGAGLSGPFDWALTMAEQDGYRVDVSVAGTVLVSWTRKTLPGWLHELEAAGWQTERVDVSRDAAHPLARAGIILRRPGPSGPHEQG